MSEAFYSHKNIRLEDHLAKVAKDAEALLSQTRASKEAGYLAGIFHDIGKLNPYYQDIIKGKENKNYADYHSPFSAYLCYEMCNEERSKPEDICLATLCVYAHHTRLREAIELKIDDPKFKKTFEKIKENLQIFIPELANKDRKIEDKIEKKLREEIYNFPSFTEKLIGKNPDIFFEAAAVYSALIQADRGSFYSAWSNGPTPKKFSVEFKTDTLKKESPLSEYRTKYQECVISHIRKNGIKKRIIVLQAPTGIGKTKIFLDIANHLRDRNLERFFYFSPLLALSDDFGEKIKKTLERKDLAKVLRYDHAFKGESFAEKKESSQDMEGEEGDFGWSFKVESFDYEIVITTMQRLLRILFSNYASDKMKFLSLKNSILIIDEVQTIPKSFMPAVIKAVRWICENMNSYAVFVSATMPMSMIGEEEAETIENDEIKRLKNEYLENTRKTIEYVREFDIGRANENKKVLIMFNTRRKAKEAYEKLDAHIYLSAGIKKDDRKKRLGRIEGEKNCCVVSTQVLEAGVDISFNKIYREVAPLDNIIQVMGRLKREQKYEDGQKSQDADLVIFGIMDDNAPYDKLEMYISNKYLCRAFCSKNLYEILDKYYEELAKRHKNNNEMAEAFMKKINKLKFDEVREKMEKLFESSHTVYIPPQDKYDEMVRQLKDYESSRMANLAEIYGKYSAQLPLSFDREALSYMDEELKERGILIPRKDKIADIYDETFGLDKWIRK